MVWSGITKNINAICQTKHRSVEFQNFGIFVPIVEETAGDDVSLTQSARLTSKVLNQMGEK
jgi:hypothetical protein